jgi:hypothetical protein
MSRKWHTMSESCQFFSLTDLNKNWQESQHEKLSNKFNCGPTFHEQNFYEFSKNGSLNKKLIQNITTHNYYIQEAISWGDHHKKIRSRKQRTDIGKYSFVNRTIPLWNNLPVNAFGNPAVKPSNFRKRVRKIINEANWGWGGNQQKKKLWSEVRREVIMC